MMTILLDDDYHKHPTFLNIIEAFKSLSERSQPGDAVFIHFAGHGGRILDTTDEVDTESYDEVIVPSDYATNGLIRDTLIFKTLLAPMRYGVTVTILIDTCDTGMVLDLPYSWSPRSSSSTPKMVHNDDFSFVRFLKVVKTLYESCTFTQLGRTVGSALTSSNNLPREIVEEDHSQTENSEGPKEAQLTLLEEKQLAAIESQTGAGGGLFGLFCGASTPVPVSRTVEKLSNPNPNSKKSAVEKESVGKKSEVKNESIVKKTRNDKHILEANKISFFEQVVTCTFGQAAYDLDDASLESFLKANETTSFSDRDYGETTDESYDDDYDSESRHGRRRRKHRSSRRLK
jgi:Caspase domain